MVDKTQLDIREDGVYLKINHNSETVKNDILKLVKLYQVKDVDYIAIESAIRLRVEEQKISDNTEVYSKDESIEIQTSPDKMKASIRFSEPVYKGTLLTKDDIINQLSAYGIRFGINEDNILLAMGNKEYGKWYDIAFGEPAVNGIDGYIEYFFETEKKTLKPKVLDDGSVDYRNLDLFEMAVEGKTLAVSHPEIPGKDGINVMGKSVFATKAKRPPSLPKGKGTKVLDDGVTLVAETSGRVFYMDGRVSILPVLEIGGNVDNTTGNIDFIGKVIIKGNVVSGFSVTAGAEIEINGSVEGAKIKSNGDIIIAKGVQGGGKAVISAGGDICANFIENSELSAVGNITANSILHSTIRCGGTLTLLGKKGLLVGGKAIVGEKIDAKTIGSPMSTVTDLEVGVNPNIMDAYRTAVAEIEKFRSDLDKTEKIVEVLSKQDIRNLSEEKKKILMDSLRSKILLKTKINDTQVKIDALMGQLNKQEGRIEASDKIYNGVKATINNAIMYVRDDLNFCCLYNNNGKVVIGTHS